MKKIFVLFIVATVLVTATTGKTFADSFEPNKTDGFDRTTVESAPKVVENYDTAGTQNLRILYPGYIDRQTYEDLLNDIMRVGEKRNTPPRDGLSIGRVNFYGEIRYHYAINDGAARHSRNVSGIRTYLGFDTMINENWTALGMLEMQNDIKNYRNLFKPLQRIYARGRLGLHTMSIGSFGYLMAEGNVYDSGFTGVRSTFGGPVKYTLSYGETNDTKETSVFTARYSDYDYNLEAGIYNYEFEDNFWPKNTIFTFGGNYNFENFSLGAMVLSSNKEDARGNKNGRVFSLNYGDLKPWRKGTYGVYLKHYDQPRGTYIAHCMNGRGNSMNGFKGVGAGISYTIKPNLVANVEWYDLKDKITNERGSTWWNSLNYYF